MAINQVITASDDWMVTLWDIAAGCEVTTLALDTEARRVAISPDGSMIVAGDGAGDVYAFGLKGS